MMILPDNQFIPYGRQTISDDDITAVVKVLRSKYLTQGLVPFLKMQLQAELVQSIAVNSATSALHIACALGLVWRSALN